MKIKLVFRLLILSGLFGLWQCENKTPPLVRSISAEEGGSQYFKQVPTNLTVNEKQDIYLPCQVGNLRGRVQWSRNGVAMGFSPKEVKSSCSRCSLEVNLAESRYDLRVRNVRLNEDSLYECQVRPGFNSVIKKGLRAPVYINIQVPPTHVKMTEPKSLWSGQELNIACTSFDSKPEATILWYKGGRRISPKDVQVEIFDGSLPTTKMTVSRVKLRVSSNDNNVSIRCKVEHPALLNRNSVRLESSSKLNVFYYSEPPVILRRAVISLNRYHRGEMVELTCEAKGGNPLASLSWLKNGKKLGLDRQALTDIIKSERKSRSLLKFLATPEDNQATYSCVAYNIDYPRNHFKSFKNMDNVTLQVTFPADSVVIRGPSHVNLFDLVNFDCLASAANPPPSLKWLINEKLAKYSLDSRLSQIQRRNVSSPGGGIIVSSRLSLKITSKHPIINLTCVVINKVKSRHAKPDLIQDKKSIVVLIPPGIPTISGVPENETLREGDIVNLICTANGGSPVPHLTWSRADENHELESSNFTLFPPESRLSFKVSRLDNNRLYKCSATNKANGNNAAVAYQTFSVFYPPAEVSIKVERGQVKAGKYDRVKDILTERQIRRSNDDHGINNNNNKEKSKTITVVAGETIKIICKAGTAKPYSTLSWKVNGLPHAEKNLVFTASEFGGKSSISVIKIQKVLAQHNGWTFQCSAYNPSFKTDTNYRPKDTLVLNVLYKPQFDATSKNNFYVVEGDAMDITLKAVANPAQIDYKWSQVSSSGLTGRDVRKKPIEASGPTLRFSFMKRSDAGMYAVTATNGHGDFKTTKNFTIHVLYPARIQSISPEQTVTEGMNVEFRCVAMGNPLNSSTFTWSLPDQTPHAMSPSSSIWWQTRSNIKLENFTSVLHIYKVRYNDSGRVICNVHNGVKNISNAIMTQLFVYHKPRIVNDLKFSRVASSKGTAARLTCQASSYPKAHFQWFIKKPGREEELLGRTDNGNNLFGHYRINSFGTIESTVPLTGQRYIWRSILHIDHVHSEYFSSKFICKVTNKLGTDYHVIRIQPKGPPEMPQNVKVHTINDDVPAFIISWVPGFDGGYKVEYYIQVLDDDNVDVSHGLEGVNRITKNQTIVRNLRPRIRYRFRVRAKNKVGYSKYSAEVMKKSQALELDSTKKDSVLKSDSQVVLIGIVLIVIFGIIAFTAISVCCVWQNKRSREKEEKKFKSNSDDSASSNESDNNRHSVKPPGELNYFKPTSTESFEYCLKGAKDELFTCIKKSGKNNSIKKELPHSISVNEPYYIREPSRSSCMVQSTSYQGGDAENPLVFRRSYQKESNSETDIGCVAININEDDDNDKEQDDVFVDNEQVIFSSNISASYAAKPPKFQSHSALGPPRNIFTGPRRHFSQGSTDIPENRMVAFASPLQQYYQDAQYEKSAQYSQDLYSPSPQSFGWSSGLTMDSAYSSHVEGITLPRQKEAIVQTHSVYQLDGGGGEHSNIEISYKAAGSSPMVAENQRSFKSSGIDLKTSILVDDLNQSDKYQQPKLFKSLTEDRYLFRPSHNYYDNLKKN